jgi:hypothetical protein
MLLLEGLLLLEGCGGATLLLLCSGGTYMLELLTSGT